MKKYQWGPGPQRQIFFMQILTSLVLGCVLTLSMINQLDKLWTQPAFILVYALLGTTAVFTMLICGDTVVRLGSWPTLLLPHFTLSLAGLGLIALQGFLLIPIPTLISFPMLTAFLLIITLSVHEVFARIMQLVRAEKISLACIAIVWVAVAATWEARSLNLRGIEAPTMRLGAWSSAFLLFYPLAAWIVQALGSTPSRRANNRIGEVWSRAFRKHPERLRLFALHWLAALGNFIMLQGILTLNANETGQSWYGSKVSWGFLSLQILPAAFWAGKSWIRAHRLPRSIRSQSVPDTGKAAHLIGQHHYGDHENHETWMGYRTAVLMIDHDPNEECKTYLPSLLYRARQIQTEQIIRQIFGEKITSLNSVPSQINLAIDAEKSYSSCTDALLILTVLYLDGLPLVERRLKNLVRMLTLLDPQLATSLSESRLETLFSRLQGFFHLDFNWVDQSMQSSSNEANIEIRLENLNPKERQRVLHQLSDSQWLGNFIWISESAREQLRSESPFLSNIVERWPIQIEQGQGRHLETAIFLIKFENLIPRLQRYFSLDDIRTRLATHPIAGDTQHLVDRLQETIPQQQTFAAIRESLNSLSEHHWKGYRAKDLALDLILKLVKQIESLSDNLSLNQDQVQSLRREARELVQSIGYPSQDLHTAHLKKMALRQINELQRICLDINHPRCYEAWLLLGSLPVRKMGQDAASQLLQLVAFVSRTRHLRRDDFILRKSLEAYFQLARVLSATHETEMQRILNMLAIAVVDSQPDAALLLNFMDKKLALDSHRNQILTLSAQVIIQWERQLNSVMRQNIATDSMQSALQVRWKTFSQNKEQIESAPIAS